MINFENILSRMKDVYLSRVSPRDLMIMYLDEIEHIHPNRYKQLCSPLLRSFVVFWENCCGDHDSSWDLFDEADTDGGIITLRSNYGVSVSFVDDKIQISSGTSEMNIVGIVGLNKQHGIELEESIGSAKYPQARKLLDGILAANAHIEIIKDPELFIRDMGILFEEDFSFLLCDIDEPDSSLPRDFDVDEMDEGDEQEHQLVPSSREETHQKIHEDLKHPHEVVTADLDELPKEEDKEEIATSEVEVDGNLLEWDFARLHHELVNGAVAAGDACTVDIDTCRITITDKLTSEQLAFAWETDDTTTRLKLEHDAGVLVPGANIGDVGSGGGDGEMTLLNRLTGVVLNTNIFQVISATANSYRKNKDEQYIIDLSKRLYSIVYAELDKSKHIKVLRRSGILELPGTDTPPEEIDIENPKDFVTAISIKIARFCLTDTTASQPPRVSELTLKYLPTLIHSAFDGRLLKGNNLSSVKYRDDAWDKAKLDKLISSAFTGGFYKYCKRMTSGEYIDKVEKLMSSKTISRNDVNVDDILISLPEDGMFYELDNGAKWVRVPVPEQPNSPSLVFRINSSDVEVRYTAFLIDVVNKTLRSYGDNSWSVPKELLLVIASLNGLYEQLNKLYASN